GLVDGLWAAGRIIEKGLEVTHPYRSCAGQIDLLGSERAENHQQLTGPRHCDVESALTPVSIERTKVHRDASRAVGAIADAEEHHVALVTLDVLEVFHEHWLAGPMGVAEEALDLRVLSTRGVEEVFDQHLLRLAEGHDTNGALLTNRIEQPGKDLGDHGLRLGAIG